jgi:hypothetical protein
MRRIIKNKKVSKNKNENDFLLLAGMEVLSDTDMGQILFNFILILILYLIQQVTLFVMRSQKHVRTLAGGSR